jgi:hypothetical protein
MILAVWVRITSIVSYPGHTPSTQFSQRVAGRASSPPVLEERVCQHGRSVGTGEPGKGVLFEACQFQPSDGMPVDMGYSWTGQGLPAAEYAVDRGLCHAWALHLLVAVARFVPSPRGGGFSVAGRAARDVSWNPCPRRGSAGGARRSDRSINRRSFTAEPCAIEHTACAVDRTATRLVARWPALGGILFVCAAAYPGECCHERWGADPE